MGQGPARQGVILAASLSSCGTRALCLSGSISEERDSHTVCAMALCSLQDGGRARIAVALHGQPLPRPHSMWVSPGPGALTGWGSSQAFLALRWRFCDCRPCCLSPDSMPGAQGVIYELSPCSSEPLLTPLGADGLRQLGSGGLGLIKLSGPGGSLLGRTLLCCTTVALLGPRGSHLSRDGRAGPCPWGPPAGSGGC